MGSIKVIFSAVDKFANNCNDDYSAMLSTAHDVLLRVEKLYMEVQSDYEKINRQIIRAKMMRDEIQGKMESYRHQMEQARREADRWQAEIDYLYSHPKTVTETDSDGNETTTEVYDYAAIHAAQRERDAAQEQYRIYREKFTCAQEIYWEALGIVSQYETIKDAIGAVCQSIQSDIYEINKYVSAVGDEAEYNSQALRGVIDSLSTYLASKDIYMPSGILQEDFSSSSNGTNVSYSSGGSQAVDASPKQAVDASPKNQKTVTIESGLINDVVLDLNDLSDIEQSIDSLPDKSEIVEYGKVDSAREYSNRKYVKQSRKTALSLDWESKKAFNEYSNEGYLRINGYLRGKEIDFVSQEQKETVCQNIERMTKSINEQTLPHNMRLYRGVSSPRAILGECWETKSLQELRAEFVGKIFTEKGFCSTTISRMAAENFSRTRDGAIVEIVAPKGANGIFMEEMSAFKDEKEVLLQRGSGFKITGIEYDSRSGYVIKTQLVGRS